MSEFHVQVVQIGPIEKHPNADTLSMTRIYDYPVILRTGEYNEGDKAVYVPVDSIVPNDDPRWEFLAGHLRIKAKRLRGIYSQGLLTKADDAWTVGDDVREHLRITKYEPPEPVNFAGENEKDPGFLPVYTDIEGIRRWPNIFQDGEEVVLTEKIHGANSRWLHHEGRFWVGSHHGIKKENADNLWWKAAARYDLANKLAQVPGIAIYGEVYGQVQDLKYAQTGVSIILFDAMDVVSRKYLDYDDFIAVAKSIDMPVVPVLYRGPWHYDDSTKAIANGKTTLANADHVREGFVVRPVKERWDPSIQRVILKLVGEDYHLRKEKGK